MNGKTGEKCVSSGSYHCHQHRAKVISIKEGDIFPKCDFGGNAPNRSIEPPFDCAKNHTTTQKRLLLLRPTCQNANLYASQTIWYNRSITCVNTRGLRPNLRRSRRNGTTRNSLATSRRRKAD